MPSKKFEIRTSQLITTFGPGALVPMSEAGSAMIASIDQWDVDASDVRTNDKRLADSCGVRGFVRPPSGDNKKVPVVKFPTMVSCSECGFIQDYRNFGNLGPAENKCSKHKRALVPSRFVVACNNGHLDNFPYSRWVHQYPKFDWKQCQNKLKITSTANSASLSSIVITCSTEGCGASRSMGDAFVPSALRELGGCTGYKYWIVPREKEDCDANPVVMQRGSATVWSPITRTALTIPPWSEARLHKFVNRPLIGQLIENFRDGNIQENIFWEMIISNNENGGFNLTKQELEELVKNYIDRNNAGNSQDTEAESLKSDEYKAIIKGKSLQSRDDLFASEGPVVLGQYSQHRIALMMKIPRLTETRVLRGFTRAHNLDWRGVDPGHPPKEQKLGESHLDWLPAVEIKGEGIFISLHSDKLQNWENTPQTLSYTDQLTKHNDQVIHEFDKVTSRLVLLHTLAHILILQISIESGYPVASLRERLYAGSEINGILIYTNGGDSAGSLGGLLAHAEPDKFDKALEIALRSAQWCSNDPLCIENPSGIDSVNWGACHACVLLPEPSCEMMNSFLDRRMLIQPLGGFFDL